MVKEKKTEPKKIKKSPMEYFFSMGERFTKGDPVRKLDWDYYMMWIIFGAFSTILISNVWNFIENQNFSSLGWSFVMLGILWFQYHSLVGIYGMRKMMKEQMNKPEVKLEIEDEESMLKEFERGKK